MRNNNLVILWWHKGVAFFWKNRSGIVFMILAALLTNFMLQAMRNLYYAFDEWKLLGSTYVNGVLGEVKLLSLLEIFSGKARILALFLSNATFYFAPFQTYPFVITSYIVHFLNAVLVYAIVKKFSKSAFMAFMAGIFFVTGSVASQVFSWLGATYESLFNILFLLLSIWLYSTFPKRTSRSWNFTLLVSWLFAIISYYFKETTIILLVLLPWLYWQEHKSEKNSIMKSVRLHLPFIGIFLCIGISRLLTHYIIRGHPTFAQQTHVSFTRVLFHLIYYPLTTLAHLFIPYDLMVRLSGLLFNLQYSNVSFVFVDIGRRVLQYYILSDYLSFIVSVAIFIYIYIVIRPVRKYQMLLLFSLIYYFLQHIPLAFYDVPKGTAYFESRYYYVFLPAGAIIFALLVDSLKEVLAKILRSSLFAGIIVLIAASGFFYKQALVMKRNVFGASVYAQRMKHAMEQFSLIRSDLPDKPIIMLSGNTEYFGLARQYIPLEVNAGYVLMVWYYKTGKMPARLILEPYHFNTGEGYRVIGNKAYGYFNKKEDLLTLFERNSSLSLSQIVGFYYDGSTDTLSDDTTEIHEYLQKELAAQTHNL